MTLPNHIETLDKLYGKAKDREHQRQSDKRAVMARLPAAMLADLRALHSALGTRAAWIQCDGETLLGVEPDRAGRAVANPPWQLDDSGV